MLSETVEREIETFTRNVARYKTGDMDPNDFKRFRLQNGVYGMREQKFNSKVIPERLNREQILQRKVIPEGPPIKTLGGRLNREPKFNSKVIPECLNREQTNIQMVRVKIQYGALTSDQLRCLAEIAANFTPNKIGHITTRQDMQFHYVPLDDCPEIMRLLAGVGLTTREACGNTVRNVTCCPYAGVHPKEIFDVTPYADAVSAYFLRNPLNQSLPRKFKISFEGCQEDHAATAIHDIGVVAAWGQINGKSGRGFKIYAGGGLGAWPHLAELLEEFTPEELLIPTCEAALRLFDRYGERQDKMHARLKFLVRKWGFEEFRKRMLEERKLVVATHAGDRPWNIKIVEQEELSPNNRSLKFQGKVEQVLGFLGQAAPGFERWRNTNTTAQKQPGYSMVTVNCLLGDITSERMHSLADIADSFAGGLLRTTIDQNIALRWVKGEHLPAVFHALVNVGLAAPGAGRMQDITRCPGSDTCQLAVTRSKGLASALLELFNNGLSKYADLKDIHIKISGCTNSCGQHHIGTIGFYGTYRRIDGKEAPYYQLLLGGSTEDGKARFGQAILAIPARKAPVCVKRLVEIYDSEKKDGEKFGDVMVRLGKDRLRSELEPLATLSPPNITSADFYDWGEDKQFVTQIGQGECAA